MSDSPRDVRVMNAWLAKHELPRKGIKLITSDRVKINKARKEAEKISKEKHCFKSQSPQ